MTFVRFLPVLTLVACHVSPPPPAADVAPGQGGNPAMMSFAHSVTVHDPEHGLDVRCDFTREAGAAVCDATSAQGTRHVIVSSWVAGNGDKKPGPALDLWTTLDALPPGLATDAALAPPAPSNALRFEVDHPSQRLTFVRIDGNRWSSATEGTTPRAFEEPGIAAAWQELLRSSGLGTS